jgi:glycosyltransferase involved in cell wall biosynthesis
MTRGKRGKMLSAVRYSLIIPCYNEAKNLPGLVERLQAFLAVAPGGEVVLVDNGSTDETPQVLPALIAGLDGVRLLRVDVNQGYGFGILSGLREGRGEILGWTHADLQTDPNDALRGLALFDAAAEPGRMFVKGRRYGRSAFDVIFTLGMSAFETLLTGFVMHDINAQPNLFHRNFFETWENAPTDFALDLYVYWQAKRARLTVKRFPTHFPPRQHGVSHWNTGLAGKWKFIKRTIGFSLRLRFKGAA